MCSLPPGGHPWPGCRTPGKPRRSTSAWVGGAAGRGPAGPGLRPGADQMALLARDAARLGAGGSRAASRFGRAGRLGGLSPDRGWAGPGPYPNRGGRATGCALKRTGGPRAASRFGRAGGQAPGLRPKSGGRAVRAGCISRWTGGPYPDRAGRATGGFPTRTGELLGRAAWEGCVGGPFLAPGKQISRSTDRPPGVELPT